MDDDVPRHRGHGTWFELRCNQGLVGTMYIAIGSFLSVLIFYTFAANTPTLECLTQLPGYSIFTMRLLVGLVASLWLATTTAISTGRFHRREGGTEPYKLAEKRLETPWTRKVGTSPWPEYPRPLLERSSWKNLNGVWQYQNVSEGAGFFSPSFGKDLAKSVLVPFCLESQLSGEQPSQAERLKCHLKKVNKQV